MTGALSYGVTGAVKLWCDRGLTLWGDKGEDFTQPPSKVKSRLVHEYLKGNVAILYENLPV